MRTICSAARAGHTASHRKPVTCANIASTPPAHPGLAWSDPPLRKPTTTGIARADVAGPCGQHWLPLPPGQPGEEWW